MARVKLDDVAADAGVSKATVSMVINNNPLVAEATRERVKESIRRTGYVYNSAAGSMRKKQSDVFGLIVTTLHDPYFAEFAESFQAALHERGVDVLLGVSGDDPLRQDSLLRSMAGRRADGIAVAPAPDTDPASLQVAGAPVLLLGRRVPGAQSDYVGGDDGTGSQAAAEHLITHHGRQRLAFVGGTPGSSTLQERTAGFLRALDAHGLETKDEWRPACESDRRLARAAAHGLLAGGGFDGVVCHDDVVAMGVLDAAHELGMAVGSELSVTGFGDTAAAELSTPQLTTVAVPAGDAGRVAAALLVDRVKGARTPWQDHVLATELRVRQSCGCAGAAER